MGSLNPVNNYHNAKVCSRLGFLDSCDGDLISGIEWNCERRSRDMTLTR